MLTFKDSYLKPYGEQLLKIIDEAGNNLRSELLKFPLSEDSGIIQQEHRDDLFPVLLIILLAKMQKRKVGSEFCAIAHHSLSRDEGMGTIHLRQGAV